MLIFHFKIHAKSVEDNEIELNAGAVCAATIKKREEKKLKRIFHEIFMCAQVAKKSSSSSSFFCDNARFWLESQWN